jgi:formate dehydrogenase maturation protein FdhE
MDRADSERQSDRKVQKEERTTFCPACASTPDLVVSILDSRKGRVVRLFECKCGEMIWDD